ncbi:MAG: DUF6468 domain-containing protein [Alphaproteobacteria bacterium]
MSLEIFNLFMDLAIMLALAVTIFYAVRLSRHLNNFRTQRDAFMNLIFDLSRQIEGAQTAVNRLSNVGQKTGQDLQRAINEARGILSELEVVNQSAGALSQRLERQRDYSKTPKPVDFAAQAPLETMERSATFFIQDRDFGGGDDEDFTDEEDSANTVFKSKAEKDLWRVLRRNKKFTNPSGVA